MPAEEPFRAPYLSLSSVIRDRICAHPIPTLRRLEPAFVPPQPHPVPNICAPGSGWFFNLARTAFYAAPALSPSYLGFARSPPYWPGLKVLVSSSPRAEERFATSSLLL
jgi:hypothetical protein